jgi:hypothetical protein
MKKLCGESINPGANGLRKRDEGGFQAPITSRKGTEARRKSATMRKNPLIFRQFSVLTSALPGSGEEIQETGCLTKELDPPFPILGERYGIRTYKESLDGARKRCGMCPDVFERGQPEAIPNPARRGPKSRQAWDFVVSLLAITRWGRLRSLQRRPCRQRPDQFVEKSAVFMVSGEVLLMEGPLVRSGFPCGASGDTDGHAVGWYDAPGGDYCPGGNDSPFFHHGAVKHEGSQSDERVVMDGAAVEHCSVTHNYAISYIKRKAPAGDVQHAMVLYVGLSSYLNGVNVPPRHSIKPQVAPISYFYISQYDDPGSEKHILADPGPDSVVFVDHYA